MNPKKASVIIPVFNTEKYLEQSVLSIINQSLTDIEIIIVNDGSTDSSLDIIQKLAKQDNRIQIISNHNNGLSIARNSGIYRATGEYIYFFDSDDLLDKNTLELCYHKCKQNQLDFIFFDADVFTDDEISTSNFNYIRSDKYEDITYSGINILEKQLSSGGYRSSSCLNFINRKFLNDIQLYFYPKIVHEDELFTFILYLRARRVGLYKKTFFHRRIRKDSIMTTTFGDKNIIGYLTVCRELYYHSLQYGISLTCVQLLKQRISDLLQVIMNNIDKTNKNKLNEIKNIILHEFQTCIPKKEYQEHKFPFLYRVYKKLTLHNSEKKLSLY